MKHRNVAAELASLDEKINALLPPRYQHCYTDVSPASMGSAGIKYGPDGKVAWDQIWTSFCDLALAGGPPHRGSLLEPVSAAEAKTDPERYREVVAEIGRAIGMTTSLATDDEPTPGWVGVRCESLQEAAWLQFAVTAENVSARRRGSVLQLPAGPAFRVEKEIKNVIVALAKSSHYWDGHLSYTQQSLAGDGLWEPAAPSEALASPAAYEAALAQVLGGLSASGLPNSPRRYVGWVGVEAQSEEDAVWLLRSVLVGRVLARREEKVLFLPVGAAPDADQAARVTWYFNQAWDLRKASSPRRSSWR
jgi:sirohydrochlorin cobaltochelatase